MQLWLLCLFLLLIVAAVFDLRTRTIPNAVTYPGLVAAAALPVFSLTPVSLGTAIIGCLVAFSIGRFLFLISGLGGGDVKLMAMVGMFTGWPLILDTLFYFVIYGVVIALAYLVLRAKVGEMLKGLVLYVKGFVYPGLGFSIPKIDIEVPMALAMLLATATSVYFHAASKNPLSNLMP